MGSHDSKVRVDTNIKVFVKRLLCKALLCCCDAILPCGNFFQMPMLLPHMMNIRIRAYTIQGYIECLLELEK